MIHRTGLELPGVRRGLRVGRARVIVSLPEGQPELGRDASVMMATQRRSLTARTPVSQRSGPEPRLRFGLGVDLSATVTPRAWQRSLTGDSRRPARSGRRGRSFLSLCATCMLAT